MATLAAALCAENPDVKIDAAKTYQTIDNFAAADAWCGNLVGRYFDDAQKGQIAKWLFSQKLGADGNPEGIGLSLWRVNLGGRRNSPRPFCLDADGRLKKIEYVSSTCL